MSKKIKRVTMNGVELSSNKDDWWMHGDVWICKTVDLYAFKKHGLVSIEYEPEIVRCDHWGAPGCVKLSCCHYNEHLHGTDCSDSLCDTCELDTTCIPNAHGWAEAHKCEHGETGECWKCDMLQAWRDGDLEAMDLLDNNIWHLQTPEPSFLRPPSAYRRRRPKPVEVKAEEVEEWPITVDGYGALIASKKSKGGMLAAIDVQNNAWFRGYKFADGGIGANLWKQAYPTGRYEHAVAVQMAKEKK